MPHLLDLSIARMLIGVLALLAGVGSARADAEAPSGKINGTFYLGRPGCAGDRSKYCQVNIQIYGDLARLLYENMRSNTAADACVEGFGKSDQALYCTLGGSGEYQCDMGYDFARRKLVRSDVTC